MFILKFTRGERDGRLRSAAHKLHRVFYKRNLRVRCWRRGTCMQSMTTSFARELREVTWFGIGQTSSFSIHDTCHRTQSLKLIDFPGFCESSERKDGFLSFFKFSPNALNVLNNRKVNDFLRRSTRHTHRKRRVFRRHVEQYTRLIMPVNWVTFHIRPRMRLQTDTQVTCVRVCVYCFSTVAKKKKINK